MLNESQESGEPPLASVMLDSMCSNFFRRTKSSLGLRSSCSVSTGRGPATASGKKGVRKTGKHH